MILMYITLYSTLRPSTRLVIITIGYEWKLTCLPKFRKHKIRNPVINETENTADIYILLQTN